MAFEVTHVVPRGGVPAWPAPDGSGSPTVNLHEGTELQLGERRAGWAHVTAANRWTGWVERDRLVAATRPRTRPPDAGPARSPAGAPGEGAPPPPPPPGAPPPPPPRSVVSTTTNGLAVASLVLGILWLWFLGSILAVAFGHVALGQIKRSGGLQPGRGLAVAGVILGWIGVALLLAGLVGSAVSRT